MVRLIIIVFFIASLISCKEKENEPSNLNKTVAILNDSINLRSSSKVIQILDLFEESNLKKYNDSLFFNDTYLKPNRGSKLNESSLKRYSSLIKNQKKVKYITVLKDFKALIVNTKTCITSQDSSVINFLEKFNYLGEYKYGVGGGEHEVNKIYCTDSIYAVLTFKIPFEADYIKPKCNLKKGEDAIFLSKILISEKLNYKENFLLLSFNYEMEKFIKKPNDGCK